MFFLLFFYSSSSFSNGPQRTKLSKLSVSYYVLIKKSSFLGHFCVTDSQTHKLTNSQTHKLTDGKVELQSCMSQLKIFISSSSFSNGPQRTFFLPYKKNIMKLYHRKYFDSLPWKFFSFFFQKFFFSIFFFQMSQMNTVAAF